MKVPSDKSFFTHCNTPTLRKSISHPTSDVENNFFFSYIKNHPALLIALTFLTSLILLALLAPSFSSHTYYDTHLEMKNSPPSSLFWFGSDELGRDIFIRICFGARISLCVGICAAIIDLILGVIWGSTSALLGGTLDHIMMRIADIIYAVPYLLKVILIMLFFGPSLLTIILAMSLTGWINMARIVRGELYLIKETEYCLAAKCLGTSFFRLLFKHLLPNILPTIIVTTTLSIPNAIFTEAFLSFLGLGVQLPTASWGTMANDALPALRYYPWRIFFPSTFIFLTILAFNLLGDALRDRHDPLLHRKKL